MSKTHQIGLVFQRAFNFVLTFDLRQGGRVGRFISENFRTNLKIFYLNPKGFGLTPVDKHCSSAMADKRCAAGKILVCRENYDPIVICFQVLLSHQFFFLRIKLKQN